jgi:hypothetical protein
MSGFRACPLSARLFLRCIHRSRRPCARHWPISDTLISFNAETVHAVWRKALERRANNPEGAITAAKTLLESVCSTSSEKRPSGIPDGQICDVRLCPATLLGDIL